MRQDVQSRSKQVQVKKASTESGLPFMGTLLIWHRIDNGDFY